MVMRMKGEEQGWGSAPHTEFANFKPRTTFSWGEFLILDPEVLFQCLVRPLCLAITFRVVTGGEMKAHVEGFPK